MIETALIIEDLPDTRNWLAELVQTSFPGVQAATSASIAEAKQQLANGYPSLALIDLGLPDGNGIEIIRHLNQAGADTWCIVTTIFDDDQHLFAAMQAGAHGYVLKDQSQDVLVPMLQGIVRGQPPLSPSIARRLLNYFRQPACAVSDTTDTHLSVRETEVLGLIAKGYTTARTAELLGIASSTAAGYLKDIYRKLNIGTRAEATLEAARRGLIHHDTH
jgi:DNA-binding NarL/FixJ family response regulator